MSSFNLMTLHTQLLNVYQWYGPNPISPPKNDLPQIPSAGDQMNRTIDNCNRMIENVWRYNKIIPVLPEHINTVAQVKRNAKIIVSSLAIASVISLVGATALRFKELKSQTPISISVLSLASLGTILASISLFTTREFFTRFGSTAHPNLPSMAQLNQAKSREEQRLINYFDDNQIGEYLNGLKPDNQHATLFLEEIEIAETFISNIRVKTDI